MPLHLNHAEEFRIHKDKLEELRTNITAGLDAGVDGSEIQKYLDQAKACMNVISKAMQGFDNLKRINDPVKASENKQCVSPVRRPCTCFLIDRLPHKTKK